VNVPLVALGERIPGLDRGLPTDVESGLAGVRERLR